MKIAIVFLLAGALLLGCGCGGAVPAAVEARPPVPAPERPPDTPAPALAANVSVAPAFANLRTSYGELKSTLQFTATVQNAPGASVLWYVDGVPGGNAAVGTISQAGLYTAPEEAVPHPVQITAEAEADRNQAGRAIVSLDWYFALNVVAPEGTSVTASGRLPLLVEVATRMPNPKVIWTVNGVRTGTTRTGFVVAEAGSNTRVWYFAPHEAASDAVVISAMRENSESTSQSLAVSVVGAEGPAVLSILPEELTVAVTERVTLRAYENGEERAATWLVNGSQQTDVRNGWIRENVYVAPFTVPPAGEALITAVDTSSVPNRFASVLVKIRASESANARVSGTFAFHTEGNYRIQLGTITFDGAGHVTGWMWTARIRDYTTMVGANFSGTYRTELDGKVSVQATLPLPEIAEEQLSASLTFVTPDLAAAWINGEGFAERQKIVPAARESLAGRFATLLRSYYDVGVWCISWSCTSGWTSEDRIGWVEFDQAGQLAAEFEHAGNGSIERFSSALRFADGGRASGGWNQIGSRPVVAVAVTADRIFIAGVTGTSMFSGTAERQTVSPGLGALSGAYVFSTENEMGRFVADGAGNLSGILDHCLLPPEMGSTWKYDVAFHGKYEADERGRVALTFLPDAGDAVGCFPNAPVLYLLGPSRHLWMEKLASGGSVFRQSENRVDVEQLAGLYRMVGARGGVGGLLIKESGPYAYGTAGDPPVAVTISFRAGQPDGTGVLYGYEQPVKYIAVSPEMLVFRNGTVLQRFSW